MTHFIRYTLASITLLVGCVAVGCVVDPTDSQADMSDEPEATGEASQALSDWCYLRSSTGVAHAGSYMTSEAACIAYCDGSHPNVGDYCTHGSKLVVPNYWNCQVRRYDNTLKVQAPDAKRDGMCVPYCDGNAEFGAKCKLDGTVQKDYGTCHLESVNGGNWSASPPNSVPYNDMGCKSWCVTTWNGLISASGWPSCKFDTKLECTSTQYQNGTCL